MFASAISPQPIRRGPDRVDDVLDAFDEPVILLLGEPRHFVAADVEVRRRRRGGDLAHDVADELVDAVARRAERVRRTADARERLRRRAVAAQIRVRDERRVAVPRHVDLGHDRDVARPRVRDDVGVLLLRVEAAAPAADLRLSADRREVRPRLDLDAPALIVGEMQMQAIDLVQRERSMKRFTSSRAEEMARDVEHRAAPLEARHVDDVRGRHDEPPIDRRLMFDGTRAGAAASSARRGTDRPAARRRCAPASSSTLSS